MKVTVFLTVLLLLHHSKKSVEDDTVDINTLARIINFFEQNYKSVGGDGHPRQYAVAISVEKDKCQQNFSPAQNNFLTQEDATNVKNAITDETNVLYQGEELIAAGTRKVVISKKKQYNMHSESLLLNPADNSPMTKLLNKRKDGCSIFYTFKSPCVDSCLNETRNHNILNALKNWKEHDGIKAFVFKDIWKFDTKKDLQTKFKQIVAHVPLYRCLSKNECYACNGEGHTPIDAHCLPPPEN
ncbi:paired box Pax-3 [Labeo rohita]|uniref:Paired box Pax-3 n=1 Tax=Labeo rohita TaxID=84645 RepID=A0A498NVX8_LABRO|nr:paired box Pax-3 [Labeo rohita]